MKLVKLTTIDKTDIAVVADEIIGIEKGDYADWQIRNDYKFYGRITKVVTKRGNYSVRESFEEVCDFLEELEQ